VRHHDSVSLESCDQGPALWVVAGRALGCVFFAAGGEHKERWQESGEKTQPEELETPHPGRVQNLGEMILDIFSEQPFGV